MDRYRQLYEDESISIVDAARQINTMNLRAWKIGRVQEVLRNEKALREESVDVDALIAKIDASDKEDWTIATHPRRPSDFGGLSSSSCVGRG